MDNLTARQIFNRILAGETVTIPPNIVLANRLRNQLNVIRFRDRKIFSELGLDFPTSAISICLIKEENNFHYAIKLITIKELNKYSVFSISSNDDSTTI